MCRQNSDTWTWSAWKQVSTLDAAACVAAITLQQRLRPAGPAIVFPTNNGEKHGESIFYAGEIVFGDVTPDDRRFARDAREEWFWRNLNSITRG